MSNTVMHINAVYDWNCGNSKGKVYMCTTNPKDVTCPDCLAKRYTVEYGSYKPSFPRTKFANENQLPNQITHIYSEVDEAAKAMLQLGRVPMDIENLTLELFDIIHSTETALSIMAEGFNVDLSEVKRKVIEKNQQRGYYK